MLYIASVKKILPLNFHLTLLEKIWSDPDEIKNKIRIHNTDFFIFQFSLLMPVVEFTKKSALGI